MSPSQTFWKMPRIDQPEWLDLGRGAQADVETNLIEMDWINRWLGGNQAVLRHLLPRLAAAPHPVTVLDPGTGLAGIPLEIQRWARRQTKPVQVIGMDWASRNLAVARGLTSNVMDGNLLCADAVQAPLAAGSVDWVISSMFMHHFSPEKLIRLLQEAARLARGGVIMSDLVRGRLPLAAFRLIGPVFARHAFTRHDGALSVRRAYTPAELTALAHQAGLSNVHVYAHFPWRMTLLVD